MVVYATVLYPRKPDAEFNLDYYLQTHMPLVAKLWGPMGLKDWKVAKLDEGLGGAESAYMIQALLYWDSVESIKTATTSSVAEQVFGDIPNFTNIQPTFLMGNMVGSA